MKKILFYNWVPLDETGGGGVEHYQKNILNYFAKDTDYEVYYLSSGFSYDNSKKIHIRYYKNIDGIKSFDVVNSPMIAPGNLDCLNLNRYINDDSLAEVLIKFIKDNAGFEIVHLNNIEGLTLKGIKTFKQEYPETKVFYSAHNYFPICPEVNLWEGYADGKRNCELQNCRKCAENRLVVRRDLYKISRMYHYKKGLHTIEIWGSKLFKVVGKNADYQDFIGMNVDLLNTYVDKVLAVSERVREIFIARGVEENKVIVSYIGTKVAEKKLNYSNIDIHCNPLKIIYMGYMRDDKGGFFMIDALEQIPEKAAKKMEVTFVAKGIENCSKELKRLDVIRNKFLKFIIKDGYKHEEQKELLKNKHLGIVPVLWEDNLPQVAIEQIAAGVPIMTSDLGGAAELFDSKKEFVFKAGNTQDFVNKIIYIAEHRKLLNDFWDSVRPLVTIQQHIEELKDIYFYKSND